MKNTPIIHQHFLINTYPFRGKTFVKGKGVFLYDEQGNKYLDLMINYGVDIFGYQHPKITKALQDQLDLLPSLHCSFSNNIRAQAAQKLIQRSNGKLKKIYFANSGTEAVEAALKFAILASGKRKIIAMEKGFHGKTFGSLSVTFAKKYRQNLTPLLWEVEFIPFNDIKALKKAIDKKTAAVILEPVQGESGIIVPPSGYLKAVEKTCQKNNTFLILDEIQTGMGRTGWFLAHQKEKIQPDIVCLGKGLAGGIPVGATLISKKIASKIPKAVQTSTFGGNPLACRGILEVLQLLDNKMLERVSVLGNLFLEKLRLIKSDQIIEVRGCGLMIGIEVKGDRNQVLKNLQNQRILACPAGDQVVRFLPPYIITEGQINKVVKIFEKSLLTN